MEPEINEINAVIYGFIQEWKNAPYFWGNEIDIQVEIASRIKEAFKRLDKRPLMAKYEGYQISETFSHVCCEPPIYYESQDKKRKKCFPDIVVFHDIPNPSNPPDEMDNCNWPMLWVCEIKYETEWGGDFQKEHRKSDQNKLKALLQQKDGTTYACILDFKRNKNIKEFSPTPLQSYKPHELLTYKISPIRP